MPTSLSQGRLGALPLRLQPGLEKTFDPQPLPPWIVEAVYGTMKKMDMADHEKIQ